MNVNTAYVVWAAGAILVLALVIVASCDGKWRNR